MLNILILSGGMDSAVLLYDLLAAGEQVECLSINYSQRHGRELACAGWLCEHRGVRHDVADLSGLARFLTGSSQSDPSVPVPFGRYDEESMKLTVVPNRNMLLLAAAGAVAVARRAGFVCYGAHAGDHAIYPDCRPEFVTRMNDAFECCDWTPPKLRAPYLLMHKGEIARRGLELGVPFERTWTCYVGGDNPCGQCGACTERREAFEFAGVPDPLEAAWRP